jgi:hypothetical protein
MDDGEGLDCYDVELDRLENELVESAEDGVPDGLDELGEGDLLDLKPIVRERRNSYTLAEKMRPASTSAMRLGEPTQTGRVCRSRSPVSRKVIRGPPPPSSHL